MSAYPHASVIAVRNLTCAIALVWTIGCRGDAENAEASGPVGQSGSAAAAAGSGGIPLAPPAAVSGSGGTRPSPAGRGGGGSTAGAAPVANARNEPSRGVAGAAAATGANAGAIAAGAGVSGARASGAGSSAAAGAGGVAAVGGSGGAGGDPTCPMHGAITYKLSRSMSPTAAERDAYDKISAAMDKALSIYNCYTNFSWTVNVQYVPSVQTADGNTNGSIRFGSAESMNYITAMHETSHTLGVGGAKYQTLIVDGIFTGAEATRALREVTGDAAAELHGDQQHFWPYGLNYTSEVKGMEDLIRHCRIMIGLRKDLGL